MPDIDEPMVERLTMDCPGCSTRFTDERIDALLSQLREQREQADRAEGFIKSAVWDLTHGVAPDLIAAALLRYDDPVAPTPTRRTANE